MTKKIHFINRIDQLNIGDVACCPLNYYAEYFLKYNVIRHDLDYIDWGVVGREDIVIIGGGGVLNVTPSFNAAINKLLDTCETVIGWSVGHNTHNHRWDQSQDFPPLDYSRFALIGIRDYAHPSGLEWLPCPSGLAPELALTAEPKRRFGFIAHKDLAPAFSTDEYIDNSYALERVARYIAESEAVATYSYHMAYWTQLMGRKAIVVDKFSDKFDFFKYPPAFVETGEAGLSLEALEAAAQRTTAPNHARAEARKLNDAFFDRVREIVEAKGFIPGTSFQTVYQLTVPKSWNAQNELQLLRSRQDDLDRRLAQEIEHAHHGIQETHRSAHQRIDREGEIIHSRVTEREAEIMRRVEEATGGLASLIEALTLQAAQMQSRIDELEARPPAAPPPAREADARAH